MDSRKFTFVLGGRPLTIESGQLAKQANGSVLIRYGDTVVLATATMASEPREGIDFFPLVVEYEERMYAVGKIPGGWGRREGKPTEMAILSARMIDRPLRPLFPKGFRNDVQIATTVLSVDKDNAPEIPALIGASAALSISDIPFMGPVGAVHVGRVNGEFVINPTLKQNEASDIHLVVAGTKNAVMMVEAGANEVPEEEMLDAIMFGHEAIKELVVFQEQICSEIGKPKKQMKVFDVDEVLEAKVREYTRIRLKDAISTDDKLEREERIEAVKHSAIDYFLDLYSDDNEALTDNGLAAEGRYGDAVELEQSIGKALEKIVKEEVRKMIMNEQVRPDGRKPDEIRPIWCKVGLLPRVHGSGVFTRGQTQVLTVCTLGGTSDEQLLDGLGDTASKRYMHHYNFPPYSVGEVRPMRGPGRREIGHGALAERALVPVLPSQEEFPYTIRLVSEVLESNGSTSQASVCGSTLALMNAGVPIKRPVAGIAMGLIKEEDKVVILSDIQGMEDALGDMDFKVAGTEVGITAIQMDIKVAGIDRDILATALKKALSGRLFILGKMREVISEPSPSLSPFAPRILQMNIDPDKIRDVIGPGGKVIRDIIDKTGVEIDIEDDGNVKILSVDEESGEKAMKMIEHLTKAVEIGATYLGKVVKITSFGAFVEILPGKEGLVHISKLSHSRVDKVEDVVKVGDEVLVKVIEIDKQGRINLSRKDVFDDSADEQLHNQRKNNR
jgi:polyribonucleotide nucleotidyltransferase